MRRRERQTVSIGFQTDKQGNLPGPWERVPVSLILLNSSMNHLSNQNTKPCGFSHSRSLCSSNLKFKWLSWHSFPNPLPLLVYMSHGALGRRVQSFQQLTVSSLQSLEFSMFSQLFPNVPETSGKNTINSFTYVWQQLIRAIASIL